MQHISRQSRLVLEALSSHPCHLTAEEIHSQVPEVSVATVYRSLEALVQGGMIRRLSLNGKKAVYEYARTPHMHLICRECGEIRDIGMDITGIARAAA